MILDECEGACDCELIEYGDLIDESALREPIVSGLDLLDDPALCCDLRLECDLDSW